MRKLPDDWTEIYFRPNWCGDDYCNCHYVNVMCYVESINRTSSLFCTGYYDYDYMHQIKPEIIEFCQTLGIDISKRVENADFWDLDKVVIKNEKV